MTIRAGRRLWAHRLAWVTLGTLGWLVVVFVSGRAADAWQVDFRAYLDAAQRLIDGAGIYQAVTLAGPFRPGPVGLYLYSPPFALAMVPFTLLPGAGVAWWLLHLAAIALTAVIMPVRREVRLAVFVVASLSLPVIRDLTLGNVSVLVLLGSAAIWRWRETPIAGIALALTMSIRPVQGVVLVWALARRRWAIVAGAIVTLVLVVLVSLPFVGLQAYLDFLTVLRHVSDVDLIHNNLALGAVAVRLGAGPLVETAAIVVWYAIGIGAIVLGLRRDAETSLVVTLTATLFLGPLMWQHYLTLLLLPAALIADRGRPMALALPLLAWLQAPLLPLVAIAATVLPLLPQARQVAGTPAAGSALQSRPATPEMDRSPGRGRG